MTTYLISRHPGAIEWAARQHMPVDQRMAHLDPAIVQAGDVVIGSLPVNLAAQVCARGATYGDYGVFGPLLEADGMDPNRALLLQKASFFERTSNPVKAREALSSVFPSIEQHQGGLSDLFRPELVKRIDWFRKPSRHEWEAALAHASLQRHDYLRAAVFMFEAVSTKAVWDQKIGDANNIGNRKEAYKNLSENNAKAKDLEFLRNALAHGVRPAGLPEREVLRDRQTLAAALRRMADDLLAP